jgi:hypothetical protein
MAAWAQVFAAGPEKLRLQGSFWWKWPFEEPEHMMNEYQLEDLGSYMQMGIDRNKLVSELTTLAEFGAKTATGQYFVMHLGI